MSKKKKQPPALCAYCGIRDGVTRDHVIPRSLFTKLPANPIVLPVCNFCNNKKSQTDNYLRDMLICDIEASSHPIAYELFNTKLRRAVERNRSLVARAAKEKGYIAPRYTPNGFYLGDYATVPLDSELVTQSISTVVRGLYYKNLNTRLPDNYSFYIGRLDRNTATEIINKLQGLPINGPFILRTENAPEVFSYLFLFAEEDPAVTFWLLCFYGSIFVEVSTEPLVQPCGNPFLV